MRIRTREIDLDAGPKFQRTIARLLPSILSTPGSRNGWLLSSSFPRVVCGLTKERAFSTVTLGIFTVRFQSTGATYNIDHRSGRPQTHQICNLMFSGINGH